MVLQTESRIKLEEVLAGMSMIGYTRFPIGYVHESLVLLDELTGKELPQNVHRIKEVGDIMRDLRIVNPELANERLNGHIVMVPHLSLDLPTFAVPYEVHASRIPRNYGQSKLKSERPLEVDGAVKAFKSVGKDSFIVPRATGPIKGEMNYDIYLID